MAMLLVLLLATMPMLAKAEPVPPTLLVPSVRPNHILRFFPRETLEIGSAR